MLYTVKKTHRQKTERQCDMTLCFEYTEGESPVWFLNAFENSYMLLYPNDNAISVILP